jgi:hypothetical protein
LAHHHPLGKSHKIKDQVQVVGRSTEQRTPDPRIYVLWRRRCTRSKEGEKKGRWYSIVITKFQQHRPQQMDERFSPCLNSDTSMQEKMTHMRVQGFKVCVVRESRRDCG